MPFFSPNDSLIGLAMIVAAGWGFACGVCERVLLAPRRRLSSLGPAYAPAMIMAFFAAWFSLVREERVRCFFAMVMGVVFFVIGALLPLATFYLSRWILRTRFSDEANS
jgi:hypothetical protein